MHAENASSFLGQLVPIDGETTVPREDNTTENNFGSFPPRCSPRLIVCSFGGGNGKGGNLKVLLSTWNVGRNIFFSLKNKLFITIESGYEMHQTY